MNWRVACTLLALILASAPSVASAASALASVAATLKEVLP